jgi:hypothetical protein
MVSHRRPIVFTFDRRAQRKSTNAAGNCLEIEQDYKRLLIIDFAREFSLFLYSHTPLAKVI